jgi:hypothetical protein
MQKDRFFRDLAAYRSQEFRRSANYYLWPVFSLEIPHRLQVAPEAVNDEDYSNNCAYSFESPFNLLSPTRRFPVPPQTPLLMFAGFLVGVVGFSYLFMCMDVGSTWGQLFGSLAFAIFVIVIFHIGLFCLLR